MDPNRFNSFNAEDFVLDEIFCEIVGRGSLSIQSFKDQFPRKQKEIDFAVEMLHKLQEMEFQQSPEKKLEQWNRILRNQKKSVRLRFFRYAAAVLLIVGSSGVAFHHFSQLNSIEKFASSKEINHSDVTLILVDGKQININQKQANVTYSANGADVLVNDTAEMKQSVTEAGFNQMIVPFGKRSNLTLSDGTRVWVNSGSRLVYAPVFKGKIREVFLEGEAYFEVTKDEKKPFYVRTDAFKVKVYGTKFDVQAYQRNNEYNTILIEGKVSLQANKGGILSSERFIFPDQIAILSADKEDFLVTEVANIDNFIAWKEGYLIFKNEAFQSILKRVSHYYDISIELNEDMRVKRLSGKLDLKDDPERVLDGLSLISKIRYVKNANKYCFHE